MNNGSSNDVTRLRQAPTILQYSHQSRSQSDDLASSGCVVANSDITIAVVIPTEKPRCLKRGFDQVRLVIEADPVNLLKMRHYGHYNLLGSTWRAVGCPLEALCEDGE